MSNSFSARRLRTKTSDLSDFLRGTGPSSHEPQRGEVQPTPSEVPPTSAKKRSSKIPFLGRTRKKSAQSDSSSVPSASEHERLESAPVGTTTKSFPDGHTVFMISPPGSSSSPALPPPVNRPSSSLGSKFAVHLTPSKPRKLKPSVGKPSKPPSGSTSEQLLPPSPSQRAPSVDSTSSGASRNRSPTPRPSQPTITVSLSPENLEEYGDLFTLPHRTPVPQNSVAQIQRTPSFEPLDTKVVTDVLTPSSSSSTSLGMQFPNPPVDSRRPRSSQKDDPTSTHRDSRGFVYMDEPSSGKSSKGGRQQLLQAMNELAITIGTNVDMDQEEGRESYLLPSSPGSANSPPVIDISASNQNQKRRSVGTIPYKSAYQRPLSPRSIMKSPSTSSDRPSGPPTIPLPPPPPTNPPLASITTNPLSPSFPSQKPASPTQINSNSNIVPRRQRAYTTSSIPNIPRVSSPSSLSSSSVTSISKRTKGVLRDKTFSQQSSDKEDTDNPTLEQLKQILTGQNLSFDELASYLFKITARHVAEKTALEKKIESLEREVARRDNELKGLRWLVADSRGMEGPGGGPSVGMGARSRLEERSQRSQPPTSSALKKLALNERQNFEDSGTESRTSGAESRGGSGTESQTGSGAETLDDFIRERKMKRNYATGRLSSEHRSSNLRPVGHIKAGLGFDFHVPDTIYLSKTTKRSSTSSFSSSAASSTSSLLPPSPTATTVSSSLSAIPETTYSAPSKSPEDPAVATTAASENHREREERRASRAANRLSSSSISSSSSGASNAYAANLKRGRPPSIAQVLDQSPSIDHVLEKLRPFGSTTTPSAT